jgi:AbiV family abortive infection protein
MSIGMADVGTEGRHEELARVIASGTRLFEDAKLLVEHSRFAGACRIAILGLEEIGRAILDTWDAVEPLPKPQVRRTAQEHRQAAVGSALLAAFAIKEFGVPVGDISDDLIKKIGRAFQHSREARFLRSIGFGMLEKTRQVGLYRDPSNGEPDARLHSREDVECIFEMAKRVLDSFVDGNAMLTALAIYCTTLDSRTTCGN